jgi:hypothetical protein
VIIVFVRAAWELIVPRRKAAPKPPPPPNKSNTRIEPYVAKDRL